MKYRISDAIGIIKLLGKKINGKSVITSHKKSVTKILEWLEKTKIYI